MWVATFLDRWDERQAVEDDRNKRSEPLVVDGSLAFPEIAEDVSLTELEKYLVRHGGLISNFFKSHETGSIGYLREGDLLTFTSDVTTETPSNNIVYGRIYEAQKGRGAVIVLPHWNAPMWSYHAFCRHLKRLGFTTIELTLPYHGLRNRPGEGTADYFLSANIGKTLRAVRQSVLDTRRVIEWLVQRKYENISVVGISLGSCVAGLVAAHDTRVGKSALILTAGDFAEVVWTGRATRHIKSALTASTNLKQLHNVWSIISTESFVTELSRRGHRCLIISGNRDQVVKPYLTERFVNQLRGAGGCVSWRVLGCGHYSLGMFPFNVLTFIMLASFLRRGATRS
jgi:hypothetical protein